jgi:signal transduction histidine kinase
VIARVLDDGRPHRIDDFSQMAGSVAQRARELGMRSAVGCPIVVGSRTWGAMTVAAYEASFAADTETRVARFSDLVATAIANAESRAEVERLAREQAALRRVATLVAAGVEPAELFTAVSQEVAQLFGTELASVGRFDPDGPSTVVVGLAGDTEEAAIGTRIGLEDGLSVTAVYRTGRAARVDRADWSGAAAPVAAMARRFGTLSTVSSPIVVEGHLWGSVTVMDRGAVPLDTEDRLANFTDLVGTAIANAESRARVRRLADEQAALRRVATLIAEAVPPSALFAAVAGEAGALFGADFAGMLRIEDATTVTTVATWAAAGDHPPVPDRWTIEAGDPMTLLAAAAAPTRVEDWGSIPGEIARVLREELGVSCSVGCPIMVEGRAWGAIAVHWTEQADPAAENEARLGQFADLVATAIANAEARDQLAASRARLLTAGDDARRRVVRDLHDGAQQRLVHTIINLKLATQALQASDEEAAQLVGEALTHAELGNEELRELAHGILPASLTNGGLRAGLDAVTARLDVPVRLDVSPGRFRAEIEASAYFVVAEALTNVVKHAHAEHAEVRAFVEDGTLHVHVCDDGTGGANPGGRGLLGLADRVTALGGRLEVRDADVGGTLVAAWLPLSAD